VCCGLILYFLLFLATILVLFGGQLLLAGIFFLIASTGFCCGNGRRWKDRNLDLCFTEHEFERRYRSQPGCLGAACCHCWDCFDPLGEPNEHGEVIIESTIEDHSSDAIVNLDNDIDNNNNNNDDDDNDNDDD